MLFTSSHRIKVVQLTYNNIGKNAERTGVPNKIGKNAETTKEPMHTFRSSWASLCVFPDLTNIQKHVLY